MEDDDVLATAVLRDRVARDAPDVVGERRFDVERVERGVDLGVQRVADTQCGLGDRIAARCADDDLIDVHQRVAMTR